MPLWSCKSDCRRLRSTSATATVESFVPFPLDNGTPDRNKVSTPRTEGPVGRLVSNVDRDPCACTHFLFGRTPYGGCTPVEIIKQIITYFWGNDDCEDVFSSLNNDTESLYNPFCNRWLSKNTQLELSWLTESFSWDRLFLMIWPLATFFRQSFTRMWTKDVTKYVTKKIQSLKARSRTLFPNLRCRKSIKLFIVTACSWLVPINFV